MKVEIFADGACKGNPGLGGWGAILRYGSHEKEIFGGELKATNNQMELTAVIKAIKMITRPSEIVVYSDSQYVVKGFSEWLPGWKKRGWKTSSGEPCKNVELWKELDCVATDHQIDWQWVKGHSGHPENERADVLANKGIDRIRGNE